MTILYDAQGDFSSLVFRWHGTIFQLVLGRPLIWILLLIHGVLLYINTYIDEHHAAAEAAGLPWLAWILSHLTEFPDIEWEVASVPMELATFFVVFYAGSSYSRFYELYGYCVNIASNTQLWTVKVKGMFDGDVNAQWNMVRYMLAMMHVVYATEGGFDIIDDDEYNTVRRLNLLSDSEIETLKAYDGFKAHLPIKWGLNEVRARLQEKYAHMQSPEVGSPGTRGASPPKWTPSPSAPPPKRQTVHEGDVSYAWPPPTLTPTGTPWAPPPTGPPATQSLGAATVAVPPALVHGGSAMGKKAPMPLWTMGQYDIYGTFQETAFELCKQADVIRAMLAQPVPFAYFHVLKLMLALVLLLIGYAMVGVMGEIPIASLCTYTLLCLVMLGLNEIAIAMADPFGDDATDFDTDEFLRIAYGNAVAFLRDDFRASKKNVLPEGMSNPITGMFDPQRVTITNQSRRSVYDNELIGATSERQETHKKSRQSVAVYEETAFDAPSTDVPLDASRPLPEPARCPAPAAGSYIIATPPAPVIAAKAPAPASARASAPADAPASAPADAPANGPADGGPVDAPASAPASEAEKPSVPDPEMEA